jgi:hypothetical protein
MLPIDRLLIQVVPRLKPARCGVSDQAIMLAQELKAAFGIDTVFVVLNSNEACRLPYRIIYCPPAQLLETCLSITEGRLGAILVHLSGYGYSADGAPTLLADALANVRAEGRFRVAVYFHELFAIAMPWRSAFWLSRRQKNAVGRIAAACDLPLTSTRYYANWLERQGVEYSRGPVQLLPVFSAVGEAQAPTPIAHRERAVAVFGLAANRRRAYQDPPSLRSLLKGLGIREIFDVGSESVAPSELDGVPVRAMGALKSGEAAALFSRVMFGFVPHGPSGLAKSSILASFTAQGTIPILPEPFPGETDGLRDGDQVVSPRTVESAQARGLQHCSQAAWAWYSQHNIRTHAAKYRDLLLE